MVKNLSAMLRPAFDPWGGQTPWRREWLPTPVFLPGESHGRRSLVGYSLWRRKEVDTTERPTYKHTMHLEYQTLASALKFFPIFL